MFSSTLQNRLLCLVLLLSMTFTAQAQYTSEINANRPSKSMGAFGIGKSVTQLESGLFYKNQNHQAEDIKQFGAEIQLRFGAIFETLELIGDLEYTQQDASNIASSYGDLTRVGFGVKYLVYDPFKNYVEERNIYSWKANHRFKWRRLIPAVSVYGGATLKTSKKFFTAEEPEINPKITLIAQQHFSDKWALITNITADQLSSNEYRGFGYVVTLTHGFNSKWSVFAENQGYRNDYLTDFHTQLGMATLVHKNLQLDLSAGYNTRAKINSYTAQIGVSWRFDHSHVPLEL